jgi:hypothetical protein
VFKEVDFFGGKGSKVMIEFVQSLVYTHTNSWEESESLAIV